MTDLETARVLRGSDREMDLVVLRSGGHKDGARTFLKNKRRGPYVSVSGRSTWA